MVLIRFMVIFFSYGFVSLQKDWISSMLTFSYRSFILFALKRYFLIWVKALHSLRKCLTVRSIWDIIHWGCCSCLRIKKSVSLVWPICDWDIMTPLCLIHFRAHKVSTSKSWTRLIAFHIALISLGKVWIQLFSL